MYLLSRSFIQQKSQTIIKQAFSDRQIKVDTVGSPHEVDVKASAIKAESKGGLDYWWALVAIAALILFCCLLGIIVICYSWNK